MSVKEVKKVAPKIITKMIVGTPRFISDTFNKIAEESSIAGVQDCAPVGAYGMIIVKYYAKKDEE